MKVEIWSDVMCPFCYIGKRKFEAALEQFDAKEKIEVEWKSFQLNPAMKTNASKNIHQYLAEIKGWSLEQATQMNNRVTSMAKEIGLTYNFDKAIVANSFLAHRFSHFAKKYDKQNEAEEALFEAYFTDGKNTDDKNILVELGELIGLNKTELQDFLESDAMSENVQQDILEAQQIGVSGVPFFVFDRKYAVSGAQDSSAFLEVLNQSYAEHSKLIVSKNDGESCSVDGECN